MPNTMSTVIIPTIPIYTYLCLFMPAYAYYTYSTYCSYYTCHTYYTCYTCYAYYTYYTHLYPLQALYLFTPIYDQIITPSIPIYAVGP